MKKYVITGATGRIGKILSIELLAKGNEVHAIGRSSEKLKDLETIGAKTLQGDINDLAFVTEGFYCKFPAFPVILSQAVFK